MRHATLWTRRRIGDRDGSHPPDYEEQATVAARPAVVSLVGTRLCNRVLAALPRRLRAGDRRAARLVVGADERQWARGDGSAARGPRTGGPERGGAHHRPESLLVPAHLAGGR